MVFSGFIMLGQSGHSIFIANKGEVSANPISEGIETKLQWQNANYSLEFAYDDGFEFEQVIPLAALNKDQQEFVLSRQGTADKIVVESVRSFSATSYEAYYFNNHKLVNQLEFE